MITIKLLLNFLIIGILYILPIIFYKSNHILNTISMFMIIMEIVILNVIVLRKFNKWFNSKLK